jgi:uncharacterized protein
VLLGVVFVVLAVAVWVLQERMVFLPPATPQVQGRGAARVDYSASDGQPLFAFIVEPSRPRADSTGTVIVFHGNGDLADSWTDWARLAATRTGWRVFLAEYRGYGGLPGRPTFRGVTLDSRAALEAAGKIAGFDSARVVLYGHSLGAGVATELAVDHPVRAVILEAPPTSLVDVGRRSFGPPLSWMLPLVSRSPFSPRDQVRSISAPVWVAVGGRDVAIPAEMGRAVFASARNKGELLEVANADHGNIADRGGERYWSWISRALVSHSSH